MGGQHKWRDEGGASKCPQCGKAGIMQYGVAAAPWPAEYKKRP